MKHKNQKRGSWSLKKIAEGTLIAFIAFNAVLGGVSKASGGATGEATSAVEESSREELQIVSAVPVIMTESELKTETDNVESESLTVFEEPESEETANEEYVTDEEEVALETPTESEPTPETNPEKDVTEVSEVLGETERLELSQITTSSTTSERIHATFNYLIREEGFTPEAAAGVIGNMAVESCFDPRTISPLDYYGLFQWNTSSGGEYWWYDIESYLTANGYDWSSFEGQVKAMLHCSNRGFLTDELLEELKKLKNVEQAAELFAVFYECCTGGDSTTQYYRPGSYYQDLNTRKEEAWIAYYMYQNQSMEYNGIKAYQQ